MITALRAELKKIRGRFLWALPLVVVGMEFLWMMSNSYLAKPEASAEGYFNLLFQLPLLNTIFLPLILAVMASRICDAENKGNTYKLLCTMQEKKKIFDAKLLLGGIYILSLTLLEGANVLLLGRLLHFTQPLPIKHLLPFLAVLFVVSLALYLMPVSYTHLDVYKRQLWYFPVPEEFHIHSGLYWLLSFRLCPHEH